MNPTNLFRRGAKHAAAAPDNSQEASLRDAMQSAYAMPDTPPDLRRRVAHLAMQHDQQRVMTPHRLHLLWRYARRMVIGTACCCLILSVLAWPNIKTAYLLYRIQYALTHAQTLNVTTQYTDRTEADALTKKPRQKSWMKLVRFQGGQWHSETPDSSDAYLDGNSISYRNLPATGNTDRAAAPLHRMSVQDTAACPPQHRWVGGGVSLTAFPGSTSVYGLSWRLEKLGEENMLGHHTVKYVWKPSFLQAHTILWLDASNYAPVLIQIDEEHDGRTKWKSTTLVRFEIDQPLRISP